MTFLQAELIAYVFLAWGLFFTLWLEAFEKNSPRRSKIYYSIFVALFGFAAVRFVMRVWPYLPEYVS